MNNLVYVLLDDKNEIVSIYHSQTHAISDAILYNLKDWYILARGIK
jgi:hypothetical protein